MPGIRLYRRTTGMRLDYPELLRLLALAAGGAARADRHPDWRMSRRTARASLCRWRARRRYLWCSPRYRKPERNYSRRDRPSQRPRSSLDRADTDDVRHCCRRGRRRDLRLIDGTYPTYRGNVPVERLLFGPHAPSFPRERALLKPSSRLSTARNSTRSRSPTPGRCWDDTEAIPAAATRKSTTRTAPTHAISPLVQPTTACRPEATGSRCGSGHPLSRLGEGDLRRHNETQFYVERMGIERALSLDIAGSQHDPLGHSVSAEARAEIRGFSRSTPTGFRTIPIDPGSPRRAAGRWRSGSAMVRAWASSITGGTPGGDV